MYEKGKVYIWQNQVGEHAFLNGTETTIIEGPYYDILFENGYRGISWKTDSKPAQEGPGVSMHAFPGDLRLKEPPPGQAKIFEMFKLPQLERA